MAGEETEMEARVREDLSEMHLSCGQNDFRRFEERKTFQYLSSLICKVFYRWTSCLLWNRPDRADRVITDKEESKGREKEMKH